MILRLFALSSACVCLAARADAVPMFRLQPSSPLETVQDREKSATSGVRLKTHWPIFPFSAGTIAPVTDGKTAIANARRRSARPFRSPSLWPRSLRPRRRFQCGGPRFWTTKPPRHGEAVSRQRSRWLPALQLRIALRERSARCSSSPLRGTALRKTDQNAWPMR